MLVDKHISYDMTLNIVYISSTFITGLHCHSQLSRWVTPLQYDTTSTAADDPTSKAFDYSSSDHAPGIYLMKIHKSQDTKEMQTIKYLSFF